MSEICRACAERAAVYSYEITQGGILFKVPLCAECDRLFKSQNINPLDGALAAERERASRCPVCGTKLDTLRETLYVGCPNCYKNFSAQIDAIVSSVQGANVHVGKKPLF